MLKSQPHRKQQDLNDESNSQGLNYAFNPDPIITYDHMEDQSGSGLRYFSQPTPPNDLKLKSLVYEELIIFMLLVLLVLTN